MKVLERIESLYKQFGEEAALCADHVESWRVMLGEASGERQVSACEGAIDIWRDRMATALCLMELLRELRQQCEAKGLKYGDDGNPHKPDWLDQLLAESEARRAADSGCEEAHGTFMKALDAVMADVKAKELGQGKGGSGSVPCPVCGTGQILYSVASCNGHVWGHCTTKGCVTWMQ